VACFKEFDARRVLEAPRLLIDSVFVLSQRRYIQRPHPREGKGRGPAGWELGSADLGIRVDVSMHRIMLNVQLEG
jgi:hypothetical protein